MIDEQSDEPKRRIGRCLKSTFSAAAGLSVAFVAQPFNLSDIEVGEHFEFGPETVALSGRWMRPRTNRDGARDSTRSRSRTHQTVARC